MGAVTSPLPSTLDSDMRGFLPNDTPLAMTPSQLWELQPAARHPTSAARIIWLRRVLIFTGTVALTAAGGYEMYEVLQVGGVTILEGMVLGLFAMLLAWIAFSFMSALAGFTVLLFRARESLQIEAEGPLPTIRSRNAMLLPTYNEDPHRIMARLRAIHESVTESGAGSQFDWFVLSDTTNPTIWIAEEKCFLQLRQDCGKDARIFYRHRADNTARKSGNIAEWVRRFGASYDHMIILDADSLMTGDTIVRLTAAMEANPGVALIQTLPIVVNAQTLFARLQQFAGRLYGPLIAAGIAWWHGSEGNYWGHNAIIRVSAFARDAGLPELSGRKPFGGHILSHDFVEAALMRRAGWGIHMAPTLGGSFEECPPSLLDFAARDRRWCQGNLQHMAVLPARGLHWVSRLHLMTGVGSYLTAPLWLLFLVLGILISLQAQFVRPEYFPKGFSLFPKWPAQDPVLAAWVFGATMGLLILPKILAFLLLLTQGRNRRQFGGGLRTLVGIAVETFLSALIAPVMMVFQSTAVGEILLGHDAGWQVQRRDDGGVSRRELYRKFAVPTLFGVVMGASAYAISLPLTLWMSPVILGLLLAIPIGAITSSASRFKPFLSTPEETNPPRILLRAHELSAAPSLSLSDPLSELRANHELRTNHLASIATQPPRARGQVDPQLAVARAKMEDARTFDEAVSFLNTSETMAVLNDRSILEQLLDMETSQPDLIRRSV
jgi:membrane glycosyltransferase